MSEQFQIQIWKSQKEAKSTLHTWFDTCTLIKGGGVKLVSWAQARTYTQIPSLQNTRYVSLDYEYNVFCNATLIKHVKET